MENKKCDFGCDRLAIHVFKNGKNCCAKSVNQCEGKRKKDSLLKQGKKPYIIHPKGMLGKVGWSKNLTKETSEILKRKSERLKEKFLSGEKQGHQKGISRTEEEKRKTSETVKQKVADGTWHYSFSKVRTHEYKGVRLHGKWELQYAKWLDKNNINWRRPKEKFAYVFENKERYYTPDFYLVDTNEYIEIKGYETDKDRAKWKDFPFKLTIIKGKELREKGIINEKQLKGLE